MNEDLKNLPHFWYGSKNCRTAFVLSTPGQKEEEEGCPASGDTGDNISEALKILNESLPRYFPSIDKTYYRITNSTTKIMYASVSNGKSEEKQKNVLKSDNINRINNELNGIKLVILCGNNANLLFEYISNGIIIKVCHPGNRGLNQKYRNDSRPLSTISDRKSRKLKRIELWANEILDKLPPSQKTQ